MEGVAVTKAGDKNFEILGCQEVVGFKKNDIVFKQSNTQELVEPLSWENCDEAFIQNIESKIKDFLLDLAKQPDGIRDMDFKSDDNKEYKMLFHKARSMVFGFLLRPLSSADMREIERNSEGKTYLTGNMSDMFKTKKDFN